MFTFLSWMPDPSDAWNPAPPKDLNKAFHRPDAVKWWAALSEELKGLEDNNVYEVVEILNGVRPITSKPVMKIKLDKNGDIEHFKLCIVARGFKQKPGVDYSKTFTPMANLESIWIISALAAKYNLKLN